MWISVMKHFILVVSVVVAGCSGQNYDNQRNDYNSQYNNNNQGQAQQSQQHSQQQQQQYQPNRNYNAQHYQQYPKPFVPITSYKNELSYDGTFSYSFTTGDGQAQQAQGYLKNRGIKNLEAQVVQGSYSYTSPEGKPISVTYIADENGFRASGAHLPTPPPIPPAIKKSLELIARTQPVPSSFASQYQTGQYNQQQYNQQRPQQNYQQNFQGQQGQQQQQQQQQGQQYQQGQTQQQQQQQPQGFNKFG